MKVSMKGVSSKLVRNADLNVKKVKQNASKPLKLLPAVDFMNMNKTMISFCNQTDSTGAVALDHDTSKPKLKPSGAFRHTEYAKGFYKVSANGNVNSESMKSYD